MKLTGIRTWCLLIPFLFLGSVSCKKEIVGPQGDKGEAGKKGNLKKTERLVTVSPSSWIFNGGWYSADLYFPEITNAVIEKGEVEVYMKIGTQWWALPYATGDIFMYNTIEFEHLHMEYKKIHGVPPTAPGQITFRVVTSVPVN